MAGVSAPLLLATATLPIDRIGARCLVFFCGGGLLLAGRSYRHVAARALLRAAGLVCWTALAVVGAAARVRHDGDRRWRRSRSPSRRSLVVVAVATGRGWRSAWWSRRAEVAEGAAAAPPRVAARARGRGVFREPVGIGRT